MTVAVALAGSPLECAFMPRTGDYPQPTSIPAFPSGVTAIASEFWAACAVVGPSSHLDCWGLEPPFEAGEPPDVPANIGAMTTVDLGPRHGCAMNGDSKLRCWGNNHRGAQDVPTDLQTATGLSGLDAGYDLTCVIHNKVPRCWGLAPTAQITTPGDPMPDSIGNVVAISVGSTAACAIKETDSTVACWGESPSDPSSLPAASAVAVGIDFVCIIVKDDTYIQCTDQFPVHPDLGAVTAIKVTGRLACALSDGDLVCWRATDTAPFSGTYDDLDTTTFNLTTITDFDPGPDYVCAMGAPIATGPPDSSDDSSSLSGGAVAGIVIAVLIVVAVGIIWLRPSDDSASPMLSLYET